MGKFAVPFPRTNYLKNSFGYSGAVAWDSLPVDLRMTNSLSESQCYVLEILVSLRCTL